MKTLNCSMPFILLMFMVLQTVSVNSQTNVYNYSVKNRWTVKASFSTYKTAFHGGLMIFVGDNFDPDKMHKMANFKVEANYGINKFIEIGVFTGFQHYEYWKDYTTDTLSKGFAPLFGVNANFHILPFFVTSKNCRWDLYLTTKYGGCYLPHKEIDQPDFLYSKYRHEYGLGLGIGYYIKNIIGIFAEGSVGEYFFFKRFEHAVFQGKSLVFKDLTDSNFSFRIGIAAKF